MQNEVKTHWIDDWKHKEHPLLKDTAQMEVVSGACMTMCRYKIPQKVKLAPHSHPHEQIAYVIKGKMKMKIGDADFLMGPGDVKIIPGNVEHAGEILETPFEELDIFNPVRQDFLE